MADATKPAPARKTTGAAANTTDTATQADPLRPETENVGTATNAPSASETLAEGTPVDPTSGPQGAPSPLNADGRTGYHCGYCGAITTADNQHLDASTGEVRMPEHAGVMVVADNWAEERPTKADWEANDQTADTKATDEQ
jgi:hypothetical protein